MRAKQRCPLGALWFAIWPSDALAVEALGNRSWGIAMAELIEDAQNSLCFLSVNLAFAANGLALDVVFSNNAVAITNAAS